MLLEGNVCKDNHWVDDFALELTEFAAGIQAYLK
jgi:hypothetical protein